MKHAVLFVFFTFSALSFAQKEKDTLAYYHLTQLFDTTLTDSTFFMHYNEFYKAAYAVADSNKQWHRGQTYYSEIFYKSGFHSFSSTTHFNSLRNPLYVQQLCRDYKVIFRSEHGGDWFDVDLIHELPDIDTLIRNKQQDTVNNPMTMYHHELKKVLHFTVYSVYKPTTVQYMDDEHQMINLLIHTGARDRWIEEMTEANTPKIFIENH